MPSYFQMGHLTENLVGETDLNEFSGIILSPLNRGPTQLRKDVEEFRETGEFDIVLDPHLYFPGSNKDKLHRQPYFPSDILTADISNMRWWNSVAKDLSRFARSLGVDGVASPVIFPRVWNDEYFSVCTEVSVGLAGMLNGQGVRVLTTGLVDVNQLADKDSVFRIASILSSASGPSGYYIVLYSTVDPRREFSDRDSLHGAMILIRELENTGLPVLVAHCSSDMLLFKAAGATDCATGKFFNLRRFTKGRYEEPAGGHGQLPYWFEHSLLGFLREADLLMLIEEGHEDLIGCKHSDNYWSQEIRNQLNTDPGKPWLGLSWRQYLSWFGKTEKSLSGQKAKDLVRDWLRTAEGNWRLLEDDDILLYDHRTDGSWIRPWRQALSSFIKTP